MLEFCVDLSVFLMRNRDHVAAIHCKAGKGRTGVMISCYLLFSGVSKNALDALADYAERRSHSRKVIIDLYLGCYYPFPKTLHTSI